MNKFMITSRLKNIFALSIPVFIVHGLEEYFTGLYNVDSFYQSFSNPKMVFVFLVLILLNISLIVSYILIQKNKWVLGLSFLLSMLLIYELSHIYDAIIVSGYYPGLYTALAFPVIAVFFWKELARSPKMNYLKNIIPNILVIVFGYLGMLFLKDLNQYLDISGFQPLIFWGILLIIIGMSIRIWASVAFSKNKVEILQMNSHPKLVISGPYKYSRNPLYIGIMLVTLGFVLIAGSIPGLFLTVLFFIFWNFLIKYKEEPDLKKQFGKEFDDYKLKVNRWI